MRRRVTVLAVASLLAVPATAFATGLPELPPQAAAGARAGAEQAAGLQAAVESGKGPQGAGSDAFTQRHAAMAELHAAHPGNAAAVHAALAAGESPSSVAPGRSGATPPGQAKKAERLALRDAAATLGADDRPGLGKGRGNGGPGGDEADDSDD